jgi:hypothetical protein
MVIGSLGDPPLCAYPAAQQESLQSLMGVGQRTSGGARPALA